MTFNTQRYSFFVKQKKILCYIFLIFNTLGIIQQTLLISAVLLSVNLIAQKVIILEKEGGVYKIPCSVNGVKMKMIFDTGASAVSLSMTMANYLYENDYLRKSDIIGNGKTQTADGTIVDNIWINIRDIEISGLHLKNIKAIVIDGQNAPLLLGQTAIHQLGPITISGNKLIINNHKTTFSDNEIKELDREAIDYYNDNNFLAAIDNLEKIKNAIGLNSIGYKLLIHSYVCSELYDDCINTGLEWEKESEECSQKDKADIYNDIACSYYFNKVYDKALMYYQKELALIKKVSPEIQFFILVDIADCYAGLDNITMAERFYEQGINLSLEDIGYTIKRVCKKIAA